MKNEKKQTLENRTCTNCGKDYAHEPIMIDGRDICDNINMCDPCAETQEERANQRRREQAAHAEWIRVVPKTYRETDLDYGDYPKDLHRYAVKWIRDLLVLKTNSTQIMFGMIGESGKCKTRIMGQIVKHAIWIGVKCEWVNATQFQWSCQHEFDKENGSRARAFLSLYRSCPFLAFDDLGKQRWTDGVESKFYDLIENRTANALPMVWSSNAGMGELEAMLTADRAKPIVGRLIGFSNIILV